MDANDHFETEESANFGGGRMSENSIRNSGKDYGYRMTKTPVLERKSGLEEGLISFDVGSRSSDMRSRGSDMRNTDVSQQTNGESCVI